MSPFAGIRLGDKNLIVLRNIPNDADLSHHPSNLDRLHVSLITLVLRQTNQSFAPLVPASGRTYRSSWLSGKDES